MWSEQIYILPIAAFLMEYDLAEDIKMEGELMNELDILLQNNVPSSNFKFLKSSIKAKINTAYPSGTNIWTIVNEIRHRYHLIPIIKTEENGIVTLSFEEGAAWRL